MQPATTAPDPSRCPLCGGPNGCAMAAPTGPAAPPAAASDCWCRQAVFTPTLLARVPAAAQRQACVCARCAAATPAGAPA